MTENHHPDKELLDEIERVLNHGASNNELLTTLNQTVPKASADFQNSLEDSLIAQLSDETPATDTGDKFMKLYDEKSKRKNNRPSTRSIFTIAAAVIATILVGGLVFATAVNLNNSRMWADEPVPEGIALTATQIINQATSTGIARETGQPIVATSTPDNFMLTATAFVVEATARANQSMLSTNTATASPTFTATPITSSDSNISNVAQDSCNYVGLVENYIVSEGDTLFSIAETFEIDAQTILRANCFGDSISIQVGQILQIPVETVPVVIAVQDIPAGVEITADLVEIINFPASSTPSNVFSNIEDVVGLITQTNLRGEGAIRTYLVGETYRDDIGSVVIARRDIQLNETITDDMVTTIQYDLEDNGWFNNEDYLNAIFYSNEGVVIGQRASTFIPYHQLIHSNNVTEAQNCQDTVVGCATIDGYVAMGMTVTDRTPLVLPLGSRVDVIAAIQFIEIGNNSQAIVEGETLPQDIVPSIMMNTIVSDAILLNVDGEGDDITVSIALRPQDSVVLEYLLEADVSLRFTPHVPQIEQSRQPLRFSNDFPLTEDGLAIVSISLTQLNTDTLVNIGDSFDIQFSILPDEADVMSAMPTPQAGDVIIHDSRTSRILEIQGTQVIYVGRGTQEFPNPAEDDSLFTAISVNPDDAWIVDWYARNGANFTLRPSN